MPKMLMIDVSRLDVVERRDFDGIVKGFDIDVRILHTNKIEEFLDEIEKITFMNTPQEKWDDYLKTVGNIALIKKMLRGED